MYTEVYPKYKWVGVYGVSMQQQTAATESAQDSELTTVMTWFELDHIHGAVTDEDTRMNIAEVANKAATAPGSEIEVSWWEVDGWAQDLDMDNERACEIIRRVTNEATN